MTGQPVLLARFAADADHTGRVVLHPRLTILPVESRHLPGVRDTFETDAPTHVVGAADLAARRDTTQDVARCDDAIAALEAAVARLDAARAQVAAAEQRDREARQALDHLGTQRARAQHTVDVALERLDALETGGTAGSAAPPHAEIAALRAQVDAVRRAIDEAAATRTAAADAARSAVADASRELTAAEHAAAHVLERESAGSDDPTEALATLRARRAALAAIDPRNPASVLRLFAAEHPGALLVLVEPFAPPPDDLVEVLAGIAESPQVVYATASERMMHAARLLSPHTGALREPLITASPRAHEYTRTVGSPS